jgi:hypothetical protein
MSASPTLSPAQIAAMQKAASDAGLNISLLHLTPAADAAAAPGGFHSQQLPDGSWIIVPNKA